MAIRDLYDLSELSDKEFEEFKTRQLRAGVTTEWTPDSFYDRLYRNKKFIERFGEETFDAMTDPNERDRLYNNIILDEELERFSDDPNAELIDRMTQEGKIELLKNGYIPQKDINKENLAKGNIDTSGTFWSELGKNITTRAVEVGGAFGLASAALTAWSGPGAAAAGVSGGIVGGITGAVIGAGETIYNEFFGQENLEDEIKNKNQELFDEVRTRDIDRKRNSEEVQELSSNIRNNIVNGLSTGETSTEDIDKAFNEIVGNQSNDSDNPIYGSNYYQVFKDGKLADLPPETKIQIISDFYAMSSLYGQEAFEGIDQVFQNIVADRQNALERGYHVLSNNVTGLAGDFAQIPAAAIAEGIRIAQGDDAAYAFLNEGKINGVDMRLLSPGYWSKVTQYGTFMFDDIEEFDKAGGVSRFKDVYATDDSQWGPGRMLSESLGQMHYLAYYGLMGRIFGGVGRKFALEESALFRASAVVVPNLSMASQMGEEAFEKVSEEAMGVYQDKVNETLNNKINERLEQVDWDKAVEEYKRSSRGSEQNAIFASDDKLKEMLQMQYAEQLRNQLLPEAELENADILKQAKTQSVDAFRMESILDICKNSINAQTFRGWMYNNNKAMQRAIRNNELGIEFRGGRAVVKKPQGFLTVAAKETLGEAFDEYLDGVTTGMSSGYNIGQFNNWLQQRENPESLNHTSMLVAGLSGMSMGIRNASNPDTYYEAALGALSPWLPLFQRSSVNPKTGKRHLLTNAVYEEYVHQLEREVDAKVRVEAINQFLDENKDKLENAAIAASYNEAIEKARKSGDIKALKDAEQKQLNYIASLIESAQEDASGADIVQQMTEKLQRLANDDYTDDEKKQLGKEFISQPENKNSGMTEEEGYARMKHNAEKLLETVDKISKIRETINRDRKTRDLSETAKAHLINNALQEEDWENRLKQLTSELGIGTSSSSNLNSSSLSSKKDAEDLSKELETEYNELADNKKDVESAIEDKDKQIDKINKDNSLSITEKKIQIAKAEQEKEGLKQSIIQINKELDRINSNKKYYDDIAANWDDNRSVVSTSEILQSGAKNILYMIKNKEKFNAEQRAQIDEAINTLSNKDSEYLTKLEDAADIQDSIETTKRLNTAIKESSQGYNELVNRIKQAKLSAFIKKQAEDYKNALFSEWDNKSSDEILDDIFQGKADKKLLDEFIQLRSNSGNQRADLTGTAEIAELNEIFSEFIDKTKPTAPLLASNIKSIIRNAKSGDEAISLLNTAVNDSSLSIEAREDIKELLNMAKVLDNAAGATFQQEKDEIAKAEEERAQIEREAAEMAAAIDAYQSDENERRANEEAAKRESNEGGSASSDLGTIEDSGQEVEEEIETIKDGGQEVKEEVEEILIGREPIEQQDEEEVIIPYNPIVSEISSEDKLEEEINQAEKNGEITVTQVTNEDEVNKVGKAQDGEFAGNAISRYRVINGKVQNREEAETITGKLLEQFKWLDSANIKYQEVIDNELKDIALLNPDVHILKVRPRDNATKDNVMWDTELLVVEYTDEIADIHKGDDSIITSNGKKWLVIGALGYNRDNAEQTSKFKNLTKNGGLFKSKALTYFRENPNERFCVLDGVSTKISRINPGRLVREDSTHPAGTQSVSSLLEDTKTNLKDVKWGIQTRKGLVLIGRVDVSKMLRPNTGQSHFGNIFMLIPASGGQYIVSYIKPVFSDEIGADSELKKEINKAMTMLVSTNHRDRFKALQILGQYLYFDKPLNKGGKVLGNSINIGTSNSNIITITQEGVEESFNLDDPNTSKLDVINKLISSRFRIQISEATLNNRETLELFDEAGALMTNLQKYGTSGADFNVYEIGEDGKPIIPESPITITQSTRVATPATVSNGTLYDGNIYFEDSPGVWRDFEGNRVVNPLTIIKLGYLKEINNGKQPSSYSGTGAMYVFNSDRNNPIVIKVSTVSNKVTHLSKEEAIKYLDEQDKLEEERQREKRVKEELDKLQEEEQKEAESSTAEENVPLEDDSSFEEFLFGGNSGSKRSEIDEFEEEHEEDKPSTGTQDSPKRGLGLSAHDIVMDNLNDFLDIVDSKIASGSWKNVPEGINDLIEYLKTKGIPINNIEVSAEAWLEMIKNCY